MNNLNTNAKKGDILALENTTGKNSKATHYMVYLKPHPQNDNLFIGAMLTHAAINGNIPLQKDHFIAIDEMGVKYKIRFNKSLVVNHPVYKNTDWAPFKKVGQLSPKGIEFIEQHIAPYEQQFIMHHAE